MIYVLLPAYNEEKGLPEVLKAVGEIAGSWKDPLRVVVVDDGSIDKTSEVAQSFGDRLDLRVFRFEQNQGVVDVFKKGFRFVCEDSRDPDRDICIVLDSDNTQDPSLMQSMAERIERGDDLVIASRYEGAGKMVGCPWYRQILSYGVSWMMQLVVGLPAVKDYSTFYRAYRIRLLQKGFERYGDSLLEGKGFAVAGGMLLKLGNLTQKISEIPMILRYDLKTGGSGMKISKTIQGYLGLLVSYWRTNRFRKIKS